MDIVGKKYFYFLLSALIIIPGLFGLVRFGLKLSIDFTGGTLLEYKTSKVISAEEIKKAFTEEKIEIASLQKSGQDGFLVRTKPLAEAETQKVYERLKKIDKEIRRERTETVGPVIGQEMAQKAGMAVVMASVMIIIYIAYAFRQVPKPYSSWAFGVCAVIALIHDALVVTGIFALLGHFYKVEIDSLFVTALLTVIGFSVHDTIVVFDRIRENLRKYPETSFTKVTNLSIIETLNRSLSTSLTVVFTLLALLLFGGQNLRWFVTALIIGIVSGTYSSIFNAAPLLVLWEEIKNKRKV